MWSTFLKQVKVLYSNCYHRPYMKKKASCLRKSLIYQYFYKKSSETLGILKKLISPGRETVQCYTVLIMKIFFREMLPGIKINNKGENHTDKAEI